MHAVTTPFDLAATPLSQGVTLLEASAGTGKTFTIEGLYLRLVAERGIPIREILVCTFTNAATEELRGRIRDRLRAAREQLRAGAVRDPALAAALGHVGDEMAVRLRIAQALAGFDEARIHTIHGFCNRVLSENAFESGGAFDRALADDSERLGRMAARDFTRRMATRAPFTMLCLHMSGHDVEDDCVTALRKRGADHGMPLRPELAGAGGFEEELRRAMEKVRVTWQAEGASFAAFAADDTKVKSEMYNHAESASRALSQFADGGPVSKDLVAAIRLYRATDVETCLKKKVTLPDYSFLNVAEEAARLVDEAGVAVLGSFLTQADALLGELRRRSGTMGYDDLLYETAAALRDDGPDSLAGALRARYRAALVDEFQDTDRIQWEIFRTLFADPAHMLFLIGDPKQSIYRFRGADVHAYMEAAQVASSSYTLGTNWRSDEALVGAVNTVFSAREGSFGMEGIVFQPSQPCGKRDEARAFSSGALPVEPLRFVLPGELALKNEAEREDWVLAQLTADVSSLLDSGAKIGERALGGGDIAVIVRKHHQGILVHDALTAAGIQSVQDTDGSVFDSEAAAAVSDFLSAMQSPEDARYVRWVLAGPLFGMDAAGLASLGALDAGWEEWVLRFTRFSAIWGERGIMPAFRMLDAETAMRARLASLPGGERFLTDVLHLMELLNAAEREGKLDPAALRKWFSTMCVDRSLRPREGHQTRLESDAKAVRILTAHKSKGLEFPVVFLPFVLDGQGRRERFAVSHEEARPSLWHVDSMPDAVRQAASAEELCERVRLLYVSLTRARNRCVVYLPDGVVEKRADEMALPSVLGALDAAGFRARLEECRSRAAGGIAVESRSSVPVVAPRAAASDAPELSHRVLGRRVDNRPMLTSFTALHGDAGHASETLVELPERADGSALVTEDAPLSGIAAFPRGASVGTFFHSCLEKMDYAAPDSWRKTVEECLSITGLAASEWLDVAHDTLAATLNTPLSAGGPVLKGKAPRELLRECEFYFPARGVDVGKLAEAFEQGGEPLRNAAEIILRLDPQEVDGYLKGFIDLVFTDGGRCHILDWKSNWLGPDSSYYTPEALDAAMRSNVYFLQGALYAVALRRSMASRIADWDYEKDFGGIYYVFLRGVDGTPGHGVVNFRPSAAVLDGIEAALGITGGGAR